MELGDVLDADVRLADVVDGDDAPRPSSVPAIPPRPAIVTTCDRTRIVCERRENPIAPWAAIVARLAMTSSPVSVATNSAPMLTAVRNAATATASGRLDVETLAPPTPDRVNTSVRG
nr:hypothetical protein [Halolamina pelagica]